MKKMNGYIVMSLIAVVSLLILGGCALNKPTASVPQNTLIVQEVTPQEDIPQLEKPKTVEIPGPAQNDYTEASYKLFVDTLNEKGSEAAVKSGLSESPIRWSWGKDTHTVLVFSMTSARFTKEQYTKVADMIADIYHLKFQDNKTLTIVFKDIAKESPLGEKQYSW